MRILLLLAALLGTTTSAMARDTLYDDLGAHRGIARITDAAMTLYFTDPRLHADFDNINRSFLEPHFVSFLCALTGGPCVYKGRSMAASHKGLHIDQARFNAVVEDLQTAMDRTGIPFWTQNRLLARLAPMERDIVTR
ncbi:group I truncated hemoglobin [Lichenicoccus sp.]|uniref:group I truncated hemoglobin n=1 Tax=Lichenicoccus sp. TaxID=2781899 RepID=UPI003D11F26B